MEKVKFCVDSVGREPNICYLAHTIWDDFGFKTTFKLRYVDKNANNIYLGELHVMQQGQTEERTNMPEGVFDALPETYCSLGNQSYYEEFMQLDADIREDILTSLRDCAFNNEIYELNKSEAATINSLLRDISANNVVRLFPSILSGHIELTPYDFQYLLNGDEETKIVVEVQPYSNPPSNVHVLIGRNGVGKTRILSGIVNELTKNESEESMAQKGILKPLNDNENTDKFSNLVTVVFSAFDHFKPVYNNQKTGSIPCQYIGLKTQNGKSFKSPDDLKEEFKESIKECLVGQKKQRWIQAIEILNSDPIFTEYALHEVIQNNDGSLNDKVISKISDIFDKLSSGHKIILLTITKLVEFVDEKTLVLIDEPENHLHPPLLSSFVRAVSNLLIKRNAVGLIATHSPIVLQEVPKNCVTKINRVRGEYSLYRPEIETYGENIDTLTRDIFGLELENSGFYKTLNDFLNEEGTTYEGLIKAFNNQIGSEGRAIARSLILNKGANDA